MKEFGLIDKAYTSGHQLCVRFWHECCKIRLNLNIETCEEDFEHVEAEDFETFTQVSELAYKTYPAVS